MSLREPTHFFHARAIRVSGHQRDRICAKVKTKRGYMADYL